LVFSFHCIASPQLDKTRSKTIMSRSPPKVNGRFGRTSCHHLQGLRVNHVHQFKPQTNGNETNGKSSDKY
jgi:hypothetical protein